MNNRCFDANFAVLFLTCLEGVGNKTSKRILKRLEKSYPDKVNQQTFQLFDLIDLMIEMNLLNDVIMPISFIHQARLKAQNITTACDTLGIKILNCTELSFPECLKGDDGPVLIYYQGDLSALSHPKRAAVIGTREPTPNGFSYAMHMGELLAENDYTVVSGLAIGCDTAGHRGCLKAGGKTVAFLPCAMDHIVPKSNQKLADDIVRNGGCLVSEYAPSSGLLKKQYVERDRLQAMSSKAIFCSEFDAKSGTLHTLKYAKTYGVPIISSQEIIGSPYFAKEALKELNIPFSVLDNDQLANYLRKIQKR